MIKTSVCLRDHWHMKMTEIEREPPNIALWSAISRALSFVHFWQLIAGCIKCYHDQQCDIGCTNNQDQLSKMCQTEGSSNFSKFGENHYYASWVPRSPRFWIFFDLVLSWVRHLRACRGLPKDMTLVSTTSTLFRRVSTISISRMAIRDWWGRGQSVVIRAIALN